MSLIRNRIEKDVGRQVRMERRRRRREEEEDEEDKKEEELPINSNKIKKQD